MREGEREYLFSACNALVWENAKWMVSYLLPLSHSNRVDEWHNEPTKSNKYIILYVSIRVKYTINARRLWLSATRSHISLYLMLPFIAKWLNYNPFWATVFVCLRHDITDKRKKKKTIKSHRIFLLCVARICCSHTQSGKYTQNHVRTYAIAGMCVRSILTRILDEFFMKMQNKTKPRSTRPPFAILWIYTHTQNLHCIYT